MKISKLLKNNSCTISFEVFPPKADTAFEPIINASKQIAQLKPDFMSITYGAGGGVSQNTVKVASTIQNDFDVTALAHMTCVSSTKEHVKKVIEELKSNHIQNILALRGDKVEGMALPSDYQYAYELIHDIKSLGDFCIGGACYPECHVECDNKNEDIMHLKEKVDAGCDFLTTQMFFDNNILYNFLYKIREKEIKVPIIAGIMPVTNAKQIKRICSLSGTQLPSRFKDIVDKFGANPKAMQQAGIAYATEQIIDLVANGINGIHIYTMNNPIIAEKIMENLSEILGSNQVL